MTNGVQNKATVVSICTTPQNTDLDQTGFEALTYVEVCCLQSIPEFAQEANYLSEHCISGDEITGIGVTSGSETDVPYFYIESCAGQAFLRTSVGGSSAYAVKKVYPDATVSTTASTIYTRVKIGKWSDGGGDVDGFVTHMSGWKLAQDPLFISPEPV